MRTRTNHGAEITLGTTDSPAVAAATAYSPSSGGYWIKADHQPEYVEVTKEEYILAEQKAGFYSKFGPYHPATSAFSGGSISGRTWGPTREANDSGVATAPPTPTAE